MSDDQRRFILAGEQAGSRFTLVAPRRVPQGHAGHHLSNRAGSSIEFRDHREYEAGDDLRRIDWNAYGRTDRLIIKLFREEVSPHVDILIDTSKSMDLEGSPKREALLGLAAVFASAAANSGYSFYAWRAGKGCSRVERGADQPLAWGDIPFDSGPETAEALLTDRPPFRRHGMRVLLSDLLWMSEPAATLQSLAREAASVVVVQVLASEDVNPEFSGNMRLEDSETGQVQEIIVDRTAMEKYRTSLERHQDNWRNAAQQAGAVIATLVAEEVIRDWSLEELLASEVLSVI